MKKEDVDYEAEYHIPVLCHELVEGLHATAGDVVVDGTLGAGGHALAVLKTLGQDCLFVGVDQDEAALAIAQQRLRPYRSCCSFVHDNFRNMVSILDSRQIDTVDRFIFDLGVSSRQLDEPSRGFSFSKEALLDMRMNRADKETAYDLVNSYSREKLVQIFRDYGEEPYAKLIARAIVEKRKMCAIRTTTELADIIADVVPKRYRRIHPATKVFQALRIELNDELNALREVIPMVIERTAESGRIAVITFHSLEDRVVKQTFARFMKGCTCPPFFPVCTCGKVSQLKAVNRRPIRPSESEMKINPRSRSAKLRIVEKCRP